MLNWSALLLNPVVAPRMRIWRQEQSSCMYTKQYKTVVYHQQSAHIKSCIDQHHLTTIDHKTLESFSNKLLKKAQSLGADARPSFESKTNSLQSGVCSRSWYCVAEPMGFAYAGFVKPPVLSHIGILSRSWVSQMSCTSSVS